MEDDLKKRLEVIEFTLAYLVSVSGHSHALRLGLDRLSETKPDLEASVEHMLAQLRATAPLPGQDSEREALRKIGIDRP